MIVKTPIDPAEACRVSPFRPEVRGRGEISILTEDYIYMKQRYWLPGLFLILTLALAACGPAGEETAPVTPGVPDTGAQTTTLPQQTPDTQSTLPPNLTQQTPPATGIAPGAQNPATATPAGADPASTQAVVPPTGGTPAAATPAPQQTAQPGTQPGTEAAAPLLSNFLNYEVVDTQGTSLGQVVDYVINMCEAHLLYAAIQPTGAAGVVQPGLVLIPFEAFTLTGEVRFEGERQLVLDLPQGELANAPAVHPGSLRMNDLGWEDNIIRFWQERAPMTFNSGCPVPPAGATTGTQRVNVNLIALATEVIGADLMSGTGTRLGQVEDGVIIPQSGLVRYLVVRTQDQGMVMVPMGAINVRHTPAATGSDQITTLELLVEPEILEQAPRARALPNTIDDLRDQSEFQYWSQHVPMTREDLP
jgi:sporulation protein YlmC with PRC-barrel domain